MGVPWLRMRILGVPTEALPTENASVSAVADRLDSLLGKMQSFSRFKDGEKEKVGTLGSSWLIRIGWERLLLFLGVGDIVERVGEGELMHKLCSIFRP